MLLVGSTGLGALYQADCLEVLATIPNASVHTVFADPPFNLGKDYGRNGSDTLRENDYLAWCHEWLQQSCRVLVPGGALFVHNLPKWLIPIANFLDAAGMHFKHWIAIHKPTSLPIPNRLCPSHYGLLYYIKGPRPRLFNRDAVRVPIRKCRHCDRDVKDYGGHKKRLNPKGLNLSDVWDDVPPVRHRKYKSREANELAPIVLERVVRLTTRRGDVVFDPFAGSGTTAYVAERLGRRWICCDVNDCSPAKHRLEAITTVRAEIEHCVNGRVPRAFSSLVKATPVKSRQDAPERLRQTSQTKLRVAGEF